MKQPAPPVVPSDDEIVRAVLAALLDVVGIWFYGSAAAGRAGPASDLDIGVLGSRNYDFRTLLEADGSLARDLGWGQIDLVDLRSAGETLRFMVTTEGRRILTVDSLACGLFETHAMSMFTELYASNRPIVEAMLEEA